MTPTLSRLSPLRRIPFRLQALALCALFAIAGAALVDDYGVGLDEKDFYETSIAVADYVLGVSERIEPPVGITRYYGVAFDIPLLLIERALGLQDTRHIYLTRHLIMHLFFIAGGFVIGMLAYRMLGSKWIALLAMLMFLLHPRLYAHSFFNVKDAPFAALFVVALYLTHRAFRKDTVGAFLLCGIGAGLAINLRPFALILLPLILAMRAHDLWQANRQANREERRRILATAGIFAAAALATLYIIHPHHWENPLRFIEGIRALSQHPTLIVNLFMGETYWSDAVPWNYIPVWFAITAPPVALLLGAIGCAAVCWQAIARPIAALRDRETRFGVMLLGCFALPVVVVIALQSNIYFGWRQMYFLWGPFCLLAAVGLHHIANICMGGGICKIGARMPDWVRGCRRLHMARQTLAYGVAGFGLITTLTAIVALHPHQQVYFNALTDTKTPGALAKRYDMDYWFLAQRQSLEYLLARYPDDALRLHPKSRNALILPKSDRDRIEVSPPHIADFSLNPRIYHLRDAPDPPAFHSIHAYGSAIAYILAPKSDAYRNRYGAEYADVEANGTLLARSNFDIYAHNGSLYYLSANCEPLLPTDASVVFLHIFPVHLADLPADSRELGFENRDFARTPRNLAFFNGKCIDRQPLPDYPIARIRTGQNATKPGGNQWRADINLATHAAAQAVHDDIAAGDYGQLVAQSYFDLYLRDNALTYIKTPCAEGDTHARFFLHIIPTNPADLPAPNRERGFANLDFHFADHGAHAGDICVATRELPNYPIDRIRTGQFVSGEGSLWRVEFPAAQ